MSGRLLDVNALIALGWEGHERHREVATWFSRHSRAGWATCALTQAGFVRVLSQPSLATGATVAELAPPMATQIPPPVATANSPT